MIGKCEISGIDKLMIGQYGEGEGRVGGEKRGDRSMWNFRGKRLDISKGNLKEKMYNTDECELLGEEKFRKVKEKGRIERCENSKWKGTYYGKDRLDRSIKISVGGNVR